MDMEIWLKNIGVEYKNDEDEISDIDICVVNNHDVIYEEWECEFER